MSKCNLYNPYGTMFEVPLLPYEEAPVSIIGVPYDGTSSSIPGSRFGPQAIFQESAQEETYSIYQNKSLEDPEQLEFSFSMLETDANPDKMYNYIKNVISDVLLDNKIPVTLGGEHSISLPIIEELYKKYNDNLYILHLDAHTDLREHYSGTKFSHASFMYHVANIVNPTNIKQFGIRSGKREHFDWMKEKHTVPFNIDELVFWLMHSFKDNPNKRLYITLDLDVFDNVHGTGTSVPGGISYKDFIKIVKAVQPGILAGFDIMELAPKNDASCYSTILATHCLKELLLTLRK